jgi:hypothetical protein
MRSMTWIEDFAPFCFATAGGYLKFGGRFYNMKSAATTKNAGFGLYTGA